MKFEIVITKSVRNYIGKDGKNHEWTENHYFLYNEDYPLLEIEPKKWSFKDKKTGEIKNKNNSQELYRLAVKKD